MVCNVFGSPITDSLLKEMPEYAGKTIRHIDLAHVALNMKNAEDKDVEALKYVEELKARWGTGLSALCLVYNATGDTVTFATSHDWHGHIWSAASYPVSIANGQWGGFLHVKSSGPEGIGSCAAVVYRGQNEIGDICDWMLAWSVRWDNYPYENAAPRIVYVCIPLAIDMAYNVFGNPITDSTLEGMPEYAGKTIRRIDRAHVALNMKNAQDKDVNARKYVEELKARWGTGVSTLCVVYNATGDTVTFATSHDWHGHIGPAPYPIAIANGQWGGYLHVKTSGAATGSSAAVVYRGKNEKGDVCDWMVAWSNPWDRNLYDNTAYTMVREQDHFPTNWDPISSLLYDSGLQHTDTWNGCTSTVSTGSDTSPIFEGIMTLEHADNPPAMA